MSRIILRRHEELTPLIFLTDTFKDSKFIVLDLSWDKLVVKKEENLYKPCLNSPETIFHVNTGGRAIASYNLFYGGLVLLQKIVCLLVQDRKGTTWALLDRKFSEIYPRKTGFIKTQLNTMNISSRKYLVFIDTEDMIKEFKADFIINEDDFSEEVRFKMSKEFLDYKKNKLNSVI